jgi:hypothetical protein
MFFSQKKTKFGQTLKKSCKLFPTKANLKKIKKNHFHRDILVIKI